LNLNLIAVYFSTIEHEERRNIDDWNEAREASEMPFVMWR